MIYKLNKNNCWIDILRITENDVIYWSIQAVFKWEAMYILLTTELFLNCAMAVSILLSFPLKKSNIYIHLKNKLGMGHCAVSLLLVNF